MQRPHRVLLAEFQKARIPGARRASEPQNARIPETFPAHYPRIPPAFPAHSPAMKNVIFTPNTIAALRASRCSPMNYERRGGRIEISDAFCPWRSEIRVGDRAGFATSDCEMGNVRCSTGCAENCASSIMHSIFMHFRVRKNVPNASATILPVRLRESD